MKKNWLRMLSVLLCMALCLGLFGCGGGESGGGDDAVKDSVIIAAAEDIKAADPHSNWSGIHYYVYWTCYDRLIGYDYETGEYLPELAKSWDVSEDGKEYTFHLRDDVKWHDGTQFTAKDVVYTAERGIELSNGNFPSVNKVEAVDDYTVKFYLNEPNAVFLDKQWIGDAAIIPDGCGDIVATTINGTGAYKVKEWVIGDHMTLEANPEYWGGEPPVKEIKYVTMPESNARLMAVMAGDVDAAAIQPENVKQATTADNLDIGTVSSASIHYLMFNQRVEAFQKQEVRQAVAYALDKDAILEAQVQGYGEVVDSIIPSFVAGYKDDLNKYERNIEKAKELMAAAGYPDGFTVELTTLAGQHDLAAQVIQAQLKEIGIEVTLVQLDRATFLEAVSKQACDFFLKDRGATNADYYISVYNSANIATGVNWMGLQDPAVDELIQKITISDGETRAALLEELQVLINEECYSIPIFRKTAFVAHDKNLKGIGVIPTGGVDWSTMYWE